MIAKGKVIAHSGELATIKVCHGEYCVGCGMHDPTQTHVEFEAEDPIGVEVGQHVEFEAKKGRMFFAVLLVFWLPLLFLALGAGIGYGFASALEMTNSWLPIIFTAVFFVLGIVIVYFVGKKTKAGAGMVVLRVVPAGSACHHKTGERETEAAT